MEDEEFSEVYTVIRDGMDILIGGRNFRIREEMHGYIKLYRVVCEEAPESFCYLARIPEEAQAYLAGYMNGLKAAADALPA